MTTIKLDYHSIANGKRICDMSIEERISLMKSIGNKQTNVVVEDGGREICGFDSESMMPYHHMKVKDVLFALLDNRI